MSLLDPLAGVKWWLIGGATLALVGAIGAQQLRVASARGDAQSCRVDLATEKGARQQDRAQAAAAYASQSEAHRAEEQRRTAAIQEKVDEKDRQLARERADRVIADASAGRLQQRYAAALADARRATGNPAAPSGSASAPPGDLPADMLSGLLEVARQYRDAAEDAITAGELAERSYDSLTAASAPQTLKETSSWTSESSGSYSSPLSPSALAAGFIAGR